MVSIILIILVISQLLCFYFIFLLNMKVSKFNDLEKRQDQLLREMDDAIGLYLIEMKEENDRLIKELSIVKTTEQKHVVVDNKLNTTTELQGKNPTTTIGKTYQDEAIRETTAYIPKAKVQNAYNQHTKAKSPKPNKESKFFSMELEPLVEPSFEEKVLTFYKNGKSIDEIAKITEKGKTEIELLLKFHG